MNELEKARGHVDRGLERRSVNEPMTARREFLLAAESLSKAARASSGGVRDARGRV